MIDGAVRVLMGGRSVCTPDLWRTAGEERSRDCRLYFPLRGTAWLRCNGVETRLAPGRAYFIPGHTGVEHGCDDEMVVDWLHFEAVGAGLSAAVRRVVEVRGWPTRHERPWRDTYRRLDKLLHNPTPAGTAAVLAMTMSFLSRVLDAGPSEGPSGRQLELQDRLEPAVQYMNDHDVANPPLARVAEVVCLSPEYFHRLFDEAMGQTPHAYMLGRRMRQALTLLTTTDRSVADVGEACGYPNPFYFSRAFRKFYGLSPRAARTGELVP